MQIPLSHPADVSGFHSEATRLLTGQVAPEVVEWSAAPAVSVDEQPLEPGRAAIRNRAARAIIPQSFIRMSELVVLHRDPQRFDLLYRVLWRLVHEPDLKQDAADADIARLRQMAQAVRRDVQKMKTRLEFRPLQVKGETVPVAWYEPAHFVCELVGTWLAQRGRAGKWIVLTPDRSLYWDGNRLVSGPALAAAESAESRHGDADLASALESATWI